MSDETTDADDDPVDGPPTDTAVADGEPAADDASSSQSVDDDESPVGAEGASADEESITRCDYCRLPCPKDPLTVEHDGVTYHYCSESCRDTQGADEGLVTQYHGFRRYEPNVDALDAGLPQGVPRNSFVMLTDLAGTRSEAIMAELVWRALQRGEPVVYMTFLEPPVSVIQKFVTLEWNVLPYLESGQFHILDCFTYRLDNRERMFDRMDEWNHHLATIAEDATTTARDPTATRELESQLDRVLEAKGMDDSGIVVIDSLTELGTLVQPVQAYNFVKDVRAEVCKGRFVPIFAGATRAGEELEFPHDLGYMVDGIVEMRLNEDLVEGALIKQIRVRKMNGVLTFPEWTAYEYTSGQGIVMFDPLEEIEKSEAEAEIADAMDEEPPDDGEDAPDEEESETEDADEAASDESDPGGQDEPGDASDGATATGHEGG
jgi:KaiC/GvpD/RAD55 family RecA-like ATPase